MQWSDIQQVTEFYCSGAGNNMISEMSVKCDADKLA